MEEEEELLKFGVFNRLKWLSIMTSLNNKDQALLDRESQDKAQKEIADLFRSRKKVIKFTGWEALTMDLLK